MKDKHAIDNSNCDDHSEILEKVFISNKNSIMSASINANTTLSKQKNNAVLASMKEAHDKIQVNQFDVNEEEIEEENENEDNGEP